MPDEFRLSLLARAAQLGLELPAGLVDPLERYYRLLKRWNERINLTALALERPTEATLDRLLLEPIAAAPSMPSESPIWFDLGSGGGSPAVPLKLARPKARLTMVESKARKAAFLREVVRTLELPRARVENVRFEDFAGRSENLGVAQLVTVRAVRADQVLFDAAGTLLAPGGMLMLLGSDESLKAGRGFVALEPPAPTKPSAFKLRLFKRR